MPTLYMACLQVQREEPGTAAGLCGTPAMSQADHQCQTQRHQQPDQADTVPSRQVDHFGEITNRFVQVVERWTKHVVKPSHDGHPK
jgi:hypothetical protein